MNNIAHERGDIDAAIKLLENLEIRLSKEDGGFTIASYSEPFFCFTRPTKKEIEAIVIDTIRSYLESFYSVGNASVHTVEEPFIPQRRLKTVSRLRPVFSQSGERRPQFA